MNTKEIKGTLAPIDILKQAVEADASKSEAKQATEGVTTHLLKFAQACKSPDAFKMGCKQAEVWLQSVEGIAFGSNYSADFTGKIPACWRQTKSDIYVAWSKFGLEPKDFSEPAKMKQAKIKASKEAQGRDYVPQVSGEGVKISGDFKAVIHSQILTPLSEVNEEDVTLRNAVSKLLDSSLPEIAKGIRDLIRAADKRAAAEVVTEQKAEPKKEKGKAKPATEAVQVS